MTIATGVAKKLVYAVQSGLGVMAGPSGGQYLRRVTSSLDTSKATYASNEIRSDYQKSDFRHGVKSVGGDISGELSPLTYADFIAAALRKDFVAGATTGAITTVTAAATSPQFVRSAGSFLTDGFKIGDVIRWTGWATTGTANNARNFLITALTATQMTGIFLDGTAVAVKASGDSVTGAVQGKKTWTPTTGHTDKYFTIEHWFSDIGQSEVFTDCKVNTIDIGLPPTGMTTFKAAMLGRNMVPGIAAYFTSPTAATSSGVLASVNGAVLVGGVQIALLTGLSLKYSGSMTMDAVVGSNIYPDIMEGSVDITGQMTALFTDGTLRDYFINETEVSIVAAFTTSNAANSDFMAFVMPRVKVGGSQKDDGQKGLVQTLPFQALFNGAGGAGIASEQTTLVVQDSLAP